MSEHEQKTIMFMHAIKIRLRNIFKLNGMLEIFKNKAFIFCFALK